MRSLFFLGLIGMYSQAVAQIPKVSTGKLERHYVESSYVASRNVDVWLPDGYNSEERYAVLYMHDGQMLFDSTITWNKQEWQVDETMGSLLASKSIRHTIVVGIHNTALRHSEYFPERVFDKLSKSQVADIQHRSKEKGRALFENGVQADRYLKFIVDEVKPFIDQKYSTHTDQANTFIAGSSMGGLISLYALCEYPSKFGGAACISTHWPGIFTDDNNPVPDLILEYLAEHLPSSGQHKLYFDHGTINLDAAYPPLQAKADTVIKNQGYGSKNLLSISFEGADHNERAWAARLHIPFKFMLGF